MTTTDSFAREVPEHSELVEFTCRGTPPHTSHVESTSRTFTVPSYEGYFEVITPNSGGTQRDWKSFEHYKCAQLPSDSNQRTMVQTLHWSANPSHPYVGYINDPVAAYRKFYYLFGSNEPFGSPGKLNSGLPVYYSPRADGGFVPPPADLDALVQRSLNVMLPHIKSELSLLNSIIELKDFRSLGKTAYRLAKFAAQFQGRTLKQLFGTYRLLQKNKKTRSQQLAGGYLSVEFAIRPLISDIVGLFTALSRLEKRMNDFVSRAGRSQVHHFQWAWIENSDSYTETDSTFALSMPESFQTQKFVRSRRVFNAPTIFHAEIEYSYQFTQYQVAHARILSLLDAFGVQANPAIIWNAVPWSFLVDWVFGVSRWLDSMKTQNMEPMINIRRYLWSVKRSRKILVGHKSDPLASTGLPAGPLVYMPMVHETAYRRQVGIPSASSIESSGLTMKEVSLGAALVVVRRRRPPQRVRFRAHFRG